MDTADIHQLSDISDEHQRLCTFRGLGNVVAEILAGPHAVASPDLDGAHMRALIYHDHGNQKFSARVNTRSAIEAKKDFIQTGFPLEQTQSVETILYSQPNCDSIFWELLTPGHRHIYIYRWVCDFRWSCGSKGIPKGEREI